MKVEIVKGNIVASAETDAENLVLLKLGTVNLERPTTDNRPVADGPKIVGQIKIKLNKDCTVDRRSTRHSRYKTDEERKAATSKSKRRSYYRIKRRKEAEAIAREMGVEVPINKIPDNK